MVAVVVSFQLALVCKNLKKKTNVFNISGIQIRLYESIQSKVIHIDHTIYSYMLFCPDDAEISSTLKWLINRSRIWSSGRSRRIIASVASLSMSPTNMYLMWYLKIHSIQSAGEKEKEQNCNEQQNLLEFQRKLDIFRRCMEQFLVLKHGLLVWLNHLKLSAF